MPKTENRKRRIAILTVVIGVIVMTIFKLVYPQVSLGEVITLAVFISLLVAIIIDSFLHKRSLGGKKDEKN